MQRAQIYRRRFETKGGERKLPETFFSSWVSTSHIVLGNNTKQSRNMTGKNIRKVKII